MQFIPTVLFVIASLAIYLPLVRKASEKVVISTKSIVIAFLGGMILTYIVCVLSQIFGIFVFSYWEINMTIKRAIVNFVFVACSEELTKFIFCYLPIKNKKQLSKIEAMLVFAASGMGFGFIETFLVGYDNISLIVRSVCCFHMMLQMFMGIYWWEANELAFKDDLKQAKKNLSKAFWIPILVHFIVDFMISESSVAFEAEAAVKMYLIYGAAAISVIFSCLTLLLAIKTIKEDKKSQIKD